MQIVIDIPEDTYQYVMNTGTYGHYRFNSAKAIRNGKPLTPDMLADALMEERIRGELHSDIIFEEEIIRDVKCRLTVSIIDHRPCYCGAELREAWRESEDK